ncbi:unnamed protein product, partial [Mesorhabditis spiculigera]
MLQRLWPLAARAYATKAPRIVAVEEGLDRLLKVQWDDGQEGRFPLVWLRDCSPDPITYTFSPAMTARNFWMRDFDVRPSIKELQPTEDGTSILIEWDGGHMSRFTSDWLRLRNPLDEQAKQHRRKFYLFPEDTWDRATIEKRLKTFDFGEMLKDDNVLHDFLEAVCLDGIAKLTNGPGRGAVEQIGQRILLIHRTHFGKLPFHTDFPSLADPPQLQMLHMVTRAAEGGNSLFCDGFHIAKLLRERHPDVFETLCNYTTEYIEEGFDVHAGDDGQPKNFPFKMAARHSVFKRNAAGEVVQVQFGNAMRSWFYDCPPEDVQKIYDAMKLFTKYCYEPENILKFQLQDGETVLWANKRLLHTRDNFRNSEGSARTLEGCYFSWDIIKSRVRQIRAQLRRPEDQPSA